MGKSYFWNWIRVFHDLSASLWIMPQKSIKGGVVFYFGHWFVYVGPAYRED